jgi:hypothetical protein
MVRDPEVDFERLAGFPRADAQEATFWLERHLPDVRGPPPRSIRGA